MFNIPKKNNDEEMLTNVMPAVMQAVLEKKRDSRRILVKIFTSYDMEKALQTTSKGTIMGYYTLLKESLTSPRNEARFDK